MTWLERSRQYRAYVIAKLIAEDAASLSDAELHRVFDPTVASRFCFEAAKSLRDNGELSFANLWVNKPVNLGNDPLCICGHFHDGDVCDDCACTIYHNSEPR